MNLEFDHFVNILILVMVFTQQYFLIHQQYYMIHSGNRFLQLHQQHSTLSLDKQSAQYYLQDNNNRQGIAYIEVSLFFYHNNLQGNLVLLLYQLDNTFLKNKYYHYVLF